MPVYNEGQRRYNQSRSQQRRLDAYSKKAVIICKMETSELERTTARGETVTVRLPDRKVNGCKGRVLEKCACLEINSIPMSERNAKLAAAADAYLLARRQIKSDAKYIAIASCVAVGCLSGLAVVCFTLIPLTVGATVIGGLCLGGLCLGVSIDGVAFASLSLQSVIDARKTKMLMKSILHENFIESPEIDILKKIKFSKMTLQPSKRSEKTLMRNGSSSMALPINTKKTRAHLKKVFAGNRDRLEKLKNILRDRSNYHYLPNQFDTKGGHLKESGWRIILELVIEPDVIPSGDGDNILNREIEPASASWNGPPASASWNDPPASASWNDPPASASWNDPPPAYNDVIALQRLAHTTN